MKHSTPLRAEASEGTRGSGSAPDIVILGGLVLTLSVERPVISDAVLCIKDSRITHILTGQEAGAFERTGAELIDARDGLVMPGLINGHSHVAMTLFRGFADDLPLRQWLFERIFPIEAKTLNPDTVYVGGLLGCLEMIASGTTSFVDGYFFQDSLMRAAQEAGLRGLIAQGVIDFPAPGVEDPKDNLRVAEDFVERWSGVSDLVRPGIFCHSPVTCSETTLRKARGLAEKFGFPLQIHLSETEEEVRNILGRTGRRPVFYLEGIGLLEGGLIAAHAVHLDREELVCIQKRGVRPVHAPESNMKLASGAARVADMVEMGIPVALGTDGCASNNNLDLFGEMDAAAKLSKVMTSDPTSLNAGTVIRMATAWGARLLGLEDELGAIEVGKLADIIVLDLKTPSLCPVYDPLSAVVYAARGSDVRDVIVHGKVLMKDRRFVTLDPEAIMGAASRIAQGVGRGVHSKESRKPKRF
jgi:5-methylthioadenosine/S-adenosylhomocysteine deaminase